MPERRGMSSSPYVVLSPKIIIDGEYAETPYQFKRGQTVPVAKAPTGHFISWHWRISDAAVRVVDDLAKVFADSPRMMTLGDYEMKLGCVPKVRVADAYPGSRLLVGDQVEARPVHCAKGLPSIIEMYWGCYAVSPELKASLQSEGLVMTYSPLPGITTHELAEPVHPLAEDGGSFSGELFIQTEAGRYFNTCNSKRRTAVFDAVLQHASKRNCGLVGLPGTMKALMSHQMYRVVTSAPVYVEDAYVIEEVLTAREKYVAPRKRDLEVG